MGVSDLVEIFWRRVEGDGQKQEPVLAENVSEIYDRVIRQIEDRGDGRYGREDYALLNILAAQYQVMQDDLDHVEGLLCERFKPGAAVRKMLEVQRHQARPVNDDGPGVDRVA